MFNSTTSTPSENGVSTVTRTEVASPEIIMAGLIHELRNPLTNVSMAAEILKRSINNEEHKALVEIILRGTSRINTQINALLHLQLSDQLQTEGYSIQELLEEVLQMAEDRLLLKNIMVTRNYTIGDHKRAGDRPGIKIALANIIYNAIDAMKQQGQLTLFTAIRNGVYTLQVEDNGSGILAGNMQNLFSPHFTTKANGLGIGLTVTSDILKANKIGLTAESEVGIGTKFTLSFD